MAAADYLGRSESRRRALLFKARRFKDQPGFSLWPKTPGKPRWQSMLPEGEQGGGGGDAYRSSAAEILTKQPHLTVLSSAQWTGNLRDLTALARRVYTETLQGREILNLDQHYRVRFAAEGRGEAFSGIKQPIDAQVVQALSRLVRRAIWIHQEDPDQRRQRDTRAFHTLVAPLQVHGALYAVKLTLREALTGPGDVSPFKFYDVAILKEKIGPIGHGLDTTTQGSGRTSLSVGPTITVADLLTAFKGGNARHIPPAPLQKSWPLPPGAVLLFFKVRPCPV